MKMFGLTVAAAAVFAGPLFGMPEMRQVSTHMGEMASSMPSSIEGEEPDTLRFEPWQMLEEMFLRDDVVYLMRHGPTDWNKLDEKGVASTD
ncbi:MAG: hypothetical protein AAGF74_04540, partial [Pseudomonadota bacterium]